MTASQSGAVIASTSSCHGSGGVQGTGMQRIILVGKPNSGKSLLFNQLTGMRQKVANFPGVTVELKSGQFGNYELVDFPGTYSLNSLSRDEEIAIDKLREALASDSTALVVCNLDATRLESSLVFGLQVQALAAKHNRALVFALNLIDEVRRFGHSIDTGALEEELGSPVFAISAKTREGVEAFRQAILSIAAAPASCLPRHTLGGELQVLAKSRELSKRFGVQAAVVLRHQNSIDNFLLNNSSGSVVFLVVMFLLFQSIFTWANPLMDGIEYLITTVANWVTGLVGTGMVSDFLNDAVFAGIGSFLVFVPQIMILTLVIGILEDSGYLARAALICHRPLGFFGLSGRSFIPYLSGHACAIPAIMAARTIESPRKRLITMLTIPLMSCSARLPVYALLVSVFIPQTSYLGGLVNLQGIAFFCLYLFGIFTALMVSLMLDRFSSAADEKSDMPFILELPTYRLPHWKPLMHRVMTSAKQFIYRAGPVIFTVSSVIWVLGYFPLHQGGLQNSYLGVIGHWIEPIFTPLGLDWRYGIAIFMSFLAREVFVGALGTLFGIDDSGGNATGLVDRMQHEGLALGSGIGLLIYYVIALQCVATVATLRAETGSTKITLGVVVGYGLLAYGLAYLAVQLI